MLYFPLVYLAECVSLVVDLRSRRIEPGQFLTHADYPQEDLALFLGVRVKKLRKVEGELSNELFQQSLTCLVPVGVDYLQGGVLALASNDDSIVQFSMDPGRGRRVVSCWIARLELITAEEPGERVEYGGFAFSVSATDDGHANGRRRNLNDLNSLDVFDLKPNNLHCLYHFNFPFP